MTINVSRTKKHIVALGVIALVIATSIFFSSRYGFSPDRILAVVPSFLGPPIQIEEGRKHEDDITFNPDRIVINDEEASADSQNVIVSIYAKHGANFTGTVDVLLSNTPDFSTAIPFRYIVGYPAPDNWPKTVSWDLCFGLPSGALCAIGQKDVYARFYINTAAPEPVWTPLP